MSNFNIKQSVENILYDKKIAKRIKEKSKMKKNPLDFLLKRRNNLDWRKYSLNNINDFPIIKLKKIRDKICFGTYKIKQADSYIETILKKDEVFVATNKLISDTNNKKFKKNFLRGKLKIISLDVLSRHKRGIYNMKKYRVSICYRPHINKAKSIKGK